MAIGAATIAVTLVGRWLLENYDDGTTLVSSPASSRTIVPVVVTGPASRPQPLTTQRPALIYAPQVTDQRPRRTVELAIFPNRNGAFFTPGTVNGHDVLFIVDTGASIVSIPDRLRRNLGLSRGRYMRMHTASEVVGSYETRIDSLSIGPIHLQNVIGVLSLKAVDDFVLLGMTALKQLELNHANNRLTLRQHLVSANGLPSGRPSFYSPAPRFKRHLADCIGSDRVVDARVVTCMEKE